MCNLCFIWQYHHCDMYTYFHTIALIGVTEVGTVTFDFCAKSASISLVDFSAAIKTSKNTFGKSLKSRLSLYLPSFSIYVVRDLFAREMLTKTVIECFLKVKRLWNSTQINLSSTLNFYRNIFVDATTSTEKSTGEIDAELAQNDM